MKKRRQRKTVTLRIRCTPKFEQLVMRAVIADMIGPADWLRRAIEMAALTTLKGKRRVKR